MDDTELDAIEEAFVRCVPSPRLGVVHSEYVPFLLGKVPELIAGLRGERVRASQLAEALTNLLNTLHPVGDNRGNCIMLKPERMDEAEVALAAGVVFSTQPEATK